MDRGNVRIVALPVSSWREYKQLRLRALEKEPSAFCSTHKRESVWPDEKWQQTLQDAADRKSWIFFAKLDGRLVGLIGGYQNEEDTQNHRVQVWGMYVDELHRTKGVAKALVKRLLQEFARSKDIRTVRLEVNADQEAARHLYGRFGFKKVGAEPVVFGDGLSHEAIIMEKELPHPLN